MYSVERVVRSRKGRSLRKRGLGTVETDARAIIISYKNGNAPNLGSLQVCMWEPALRGITGSVLIATAAAAVGECAAKADGLQGKKGDEIPVAFPSALLYTRSSPTNTTQA